MLVSSARTSMGNMPPAIAQTTPVMMVVMWGVPKRGWILVATLGNRPSIAIEKKMRGWPSNMTSMTEVRPAMAPISTAKVSQLMPGGGDAHRDGVGHVQLRCRGRRRSGSATRRCRARCRPPASRGCRWADRAAGCLVSWAAVRDGVEADVGEEHHGRALQDARARRTARRRPGSRG